MSSDRDVTIMLVDDHLVMRQGLLSLLNDAGGLEVIGQAGDGEEAVRLAPELAPDLIVMDIMMPKKNGVDACREIMEILPEVKVVILTASTSEDAVIDAVAAGATGYLQKFSGMDRLLGTIRDVIDGDLRVPASNIRSVFARIREPGQEIAEPHLGGLTNREQEILKLFSQGLSYAQIAEFRGNKPLSIRNAIYGIERKLGLRTKQEIVVWAVRNGLLDDFTQEVYDS